MEFKISRLFLLFKVVAIFITMTSLSATAEDVSGQQLQEYIIGPEDVLEISVWKNQDISREVRVRPDGKISLPLIGEIGAAGLNVELLRKTITERVKEYQGGAVVSIIVKEINSYKIFILGEVARPGVFILKAKTSVLQALALAGGFNQFASKNKVVVIRSRKDGSTEKIRININEIVKEGSMDKDIILIPQDTIFVH
ncbi:MAG: putative Polysaccharide export protein [Deltaproteobacteria bacterium]|nr:putative Polysaccharide export protein [Deltaproteobacteria bacterium]